MEKKMIYFSGVHGIGKTTIINEIKNTYIPNATILDFDQFYLYPSDYLENQIYRITNYYKTIKNTNAPIILMDRGPFDALIYSEAFYEFRDETGFTESHLKSVRRVFQMIPPEYYFNACIVFLNLSKERIMKNIKRRGREASPIMFREDFVEVLRDKFKEFYAQIEKIMNVVTFTDDVKNGKSYTPTDIVYKLQEIGCLQHYEVNEKYRLTSEKYKQTKLM